MIGKNERRMARMGNHFTGINLHSKPPGQAFDFYKGLGLSVKETAAAEDKYYGASFGLGGDSTLWIWRDNSGSDAENAGRMTVELVLKCDDMDQSYEALKGKGYDVTEPELMFYGGREMNLTDPDGNKLLFLD
jgi:uncharacterized glyoxalase superfamily protein PhnB